MYVWVLETFDREDEYCEYNSEVVAIYSEENFGSARNHFKRYCDSRTGKDDIVEEWENDKGYHFRSENREFESYKMSYVGLKKMEVI